MEAKVVHDYNIIAKDPEVQVVVEAMGGVEPAYTFVKQALLAGKSVTTSNKALVAKHGAELIAIAREQNINFLFEASVGGGIPIIRPLNSSLTADEIEEITGILNGTTNYMLSKMSFEGLEFEDVLKDAQSRGYAEADPTADIEGYDACRKIAILTSLVCGQQVDFEEIYTEGITRITAASPPNPFSGSSRRSEYFCSDVWRYPQCLPLLRWLWEAFLRRFRKTWRLLIHFHGQK